MGFPMTFEYKTIPVKYNCEININNNVIICQERFKSIFFMYMNKPFYFNAFFSYISFGILRLHFCALTCIV